MENASKALIIAGSILIALMIIGAVLLMFNSLSNYQNINDKDVKEAQIVKFNNQYSTYNRDNVRGSDLYSLLNRVADYNRRKSTVGTGANDEGVDSQFQPMAITVGFVNKEDRQKLSYDTDKNNLFIDSFMNSTNQSFTIDGKRTNTFEEKISSEISDIENSSKYKKSGIKNLASEISNLDINYSSDRKEKLKAIDLYNNNVNDSDKATESNIITKVDSIMNDVKIYYEYIQFKRAYFNCKKVDYDENTGRIISMTFEFNGKFE